MKKILTIVGARPQFIKAASFSKTVLENNLLEEIIVHTGQHYDESMSGVFFEQMNIPKPKYNLQINNLGHAAMTGQMMTKIEEILLVEKPDATLVYGDTNSTLAAAIASKKLNIPLIHIEAGLRSYNQEMPEEINRILCDRISDLLLCPTSKAIENLKAEGFDNFPSKVVKVGDIMKDSISFFAKGIVSDNQEVKDIINSKEDIVLCTFHRQENTDDKEKLSQIIKALENINKDIRLIIPLHPRTRKRIKEFGITTNLEFIEPVSYIDMVSLLSKCSLLITDSGGMQKEAFFMKKHCLVLREQTEWVELIDNNFALLVGSNTEDILKGYSKMNNCNNNFDIDIFGDNVSVKIYDEICELLYK